MIFSFHEFKPVLKKIENNQMEFPFDKVGMYLKSDHLFKRIFVAHVTEKSPAFKAGVLVDDEIVSLNERSISELGNLNDVRNYIKKYNKNVLRMSIRTGNTIRTISLKPEDFL
jgi:C-terminal processing protease CtpA/Prc